MEFVPKSIRLQKLCNKAFAILPTKLKCIPECYKIHKLYSGYICFPLFDYILNPNKTHKIYDMFLYMLFNRILLWWICYSKNDEAVDNFLEALKPIPDWFVTSEMIKKLYTAL